MKTIISNLLAHEVNIKPSEIERLIEVPSRVELGDFAFPCFTLAKLLKKSPTIISKNLAQIITKRLPKEFSRVDSNGGYINFFVDIKVLSKKVFAKVDKNIWRLKIGIGRTRLIEYSQPNTHKAFHVGHIRGTSLGESLARIFRASGEKVIQMNYSGDTGMHIAKWIWCYRKFHSKEKLEKNELWIAGIYVDAIKRLKENEKLQTEVDDINRKIENGEDAEINNLWEKTRRASIESWGKIYNELNAHFDVSLFESEFKNKAKNLTTKMLKDNIAKKDDAVFMDLQKFNLGIWVLLRKDGTVLYSAKDIALALEKFKNYKSDNYLIVVGNEQKLHFEQLVKTLELMGFQEDAKKYHLLLYGMVRFPEGKMSSRSGENVLYSDFIKRASYVAKQGLIKRGYDNDDINSKSLKIAIASIKYSMLKQNPGKTMIFNPKEDIAFEGDTGAYLLYSYARANSIIRRVKSKKPLTILEVQGAESKLIKQIDKFWDVLEMAYKGLEPNLLAKYVFELSKNFNEFYHSCPVLGNENEAFRLKLVNAFKITSGKTLELLGIEPIDEM